MIVNRRRWCPIWVGILGAACTAVLVGVAIQEWPRGILALLPMLFSATHLTLTLLLNATTVTVSPEGVDVKEGAIPAGFRDRQVARSEISGVYWRHNFRTPRSGEGSHWAAGVATGAGVWMDTSARFANEAEARDEAMRVGRELGFSEVSRTEGEQPERDFRILWAILYWFGLVAWCLVWPAIFSL